MQIEYCETCRTKLSDAEFDTGLAVWINNEPYCKACGEKVKAARPASKSGPRSGTRVGMKRATPSGTRTAARATPSGTRAAGRSGRRITTPSGVTRRSGLHRAASEAKSSGTHTRRKTGANQTIPAQPAGNGPSMVMVSVIGAVIGILLAVIVIFVFF